MCCWCVMLRPTDIATALSANATAVGDGGTLECLKLRTSSFFFGIEESSQQSLPIPSIILSIFVFYRLRLMIRMLTIITLILIPILILLTLITMLLISTLLRIIQLIRFILLYFSHYYTIHIHLIILFT